MKKITVYSTGLVATVFPFQERSESRSIPGVYYCDIGEYP